MSIMKGSGLNKIAGNILAYGLGELFSEENPSNAMIYLLFGVAYDIIISLVISLAPNSQIAHSIVLLLLEIVCLILLIAKNPFSNRLVKCFTMVIRVTFILIGIIGLILSFGDEANDSAKSLETIFFALALIQMITVVMTMIILATSFMQPGSEKLHIRPKVQDRNQSVAKNNKQIINKNKDTVQLDKQPSRGEEENNVVADPEKVEINPNERVIKLDEKENTENIPDDEEGDDNPVKVDQEDSNLKSLKDAEEPRQGKKLYGNADNGNKDFQDLWKKGN